MIMSKESRLFFVLQCCKYLLYRVSPICHRGPKGIDINERGWHIINKKSIEIKPTKQISIVILSRPYVDGWRWFQLGFLPFNWKELFPTFFSNVVITFMHPSIFFFYTFIVPCPNGILNLYVYFMSSFCSFAACCCRMKIIESPWVQPNT